MTSELWVISLRGLTEILTWEITKSLVTPCPHVSSQEDDSPFPTATFCEQLIERTGAILKPEPPRLSGTSAVNHSLLYQRLQRDARTTTIDKDLPCPSENRDCPHASLEAISVLNPRLKPDWKGSRIEASDISFVYFWSYFAITHLITFSQKGHFKACL